MPDSIADVALRKGCFSEVHGQGPLLSFQSLAFVSSFRIDITSQRASNVKGNSNYLKTNMPARPFRKIPFRS